MKGGAQKPGVSYRHTHNFIAGRVGVYGSVIKVCCMMVEWEGGDKYREFVQA